MTLFYIKHNEKTIVFQKFIYIFIIYIKIPVIKQKSRALHDFFVLDNNYDLDKNQMPSASNLN